MNPDDLEQRLARTPRGGPPPEWRREILAAARAAIPAAGAGVEAVEPAVPAGPANRTPGGTRNGGWFERWAGVFQRAPWAILAAGWMVVLAVDQAGARMEAGGRRTAATRAGAATVEGPSPLAAARAYRAEVVAWTRQSDSGLGDAPEGEVEALRGGRYGPEPVSGPGTSEPLPRSEPVHPQGRVRPGRRGLDRTAWS